MIRITQYFTLSSQTMLDSKKLEYSWYLLWTQGDTIIWFAFGINFLEELYRAIPAQISTVRLQDKLRKDFHRIWKVFAGSVAIIRFRFMYFHNPIQSHVLDWLPYGTSGGLFNFLVYLFFHQIQLETGLPSRTETALSSTHPSVLRGGASKTNNKARLIYGPTTHTFKI